MVFSGKGQLKDSMYFFPAKLSNGYIPELYREQRRGKKIQKEQLHQILEDPKDRTMTKTMV